MVYKKINKITKGLVVLILTIILLGSLGCVSNNEPRDQNMITNNDNTEYSGIEDNTNNNNEPTNNGGLINNNSIPSQESFVDCGEVRYDSMFKFDEKDFDCFIERVRECKPVSTIITYELENNKVHSEKLEIISGTKESCRIKMTVLDAFGTLFSYPTTAKNESISCEVSTNSIVKMFPSLKQYWYKCDGKIINKLAELASIIIEDDFEILKANSLRTENNSYNMNYTNNTNADNVNAHMFVETTGLFNIIVTSETSIELTQQLIKNFKTQNTNISEQEVEHSDLWGEDGKGTIFNFITPSEEEIALLLIEKKNKNILVLGSPKKGAVPNFNQILEVFARDVVIAID